MPLAPSTYPAHAYVLIDRGYGRVQLHVYAGHFDMASLAILVPSMVNFEVQSLPGASDDCFVWVGTVSCHV